MAFCHAGWSWTHCAAEDNLGFLTLLHPSAENWNYRRAILPSLDCMLRIFKILSQDILFQWVLSFQFQNETPQMLKWCAWRVCVCHNEQITWIQTTHLRPGSHASCLLLPKFSGSWLERGRKVMERDKLASSPGRKLQQRQLSEWALRLTSGFPGTGLFLLRSRQAGLSGEV